MLSTKLPLLAEKFTVIILPSTITTNTKGASSNHSEGIKIGIKLNKIRNIHAF